MNYLRFDSLLKTGKNSFVKIMYLLAEELCCLQVGAQLSRCLTVASPQRSIFSTSWTCPNVIDFKKAFDCLACDSKFYIEQVQVIETVYKSSTSAVLLDKKM